MKKQEKKAGGSNSKNQNYSWLAPFVASMGSASAASPFLPIFMRKQTTKYKELYEINKYRQKVQELRNTTFKTN